MLDTSLLGVLWRRPRVLRSRGFSVLPATFYSLHAQRDFRRFRWLAILLFVSHSNILNIRVHFISGKNHVDELKSSTVDYIQSCCDVTYCLIFRLVDIRIIDSDFRVFLSHSERTGREMVNGLSSIL